MFYNLRDTDWVQSWSRKWMEMHFFVTENKFSNCNEGEAADMQMFYGAVDLSLTGWCAAFTKCPCGNALENTAVWSCLDPLFIPLPSFSPWMLTIQLSKLQTSLNDVLFMCFLSHTTENSFTARTAVTVFWLDPLSLQQSLLSLDFRQQQQKFHLILRTNL